jgi:dynein heavy chain 2
MYKVLAIGYLTGIESLHALLPEIKCELVFSARKLQFRPSLEELRTSYYREMKKFINIPQAFKGFGHASLYNKIASTFSFKLIHLYNQAEGIFESLAAVKGKFEPWVRMGRVTDLSLFIEENVQDAAQFEANFAMLKKKKKESEKIPDFHKIDCVRINLVPLKATIEDLFSFFHQSLLFSLRKKILTEFEQVDLYLREGMERLRTRPQSIEEISTATEAWQTIQSEKENMHLLSRQCVKMKQVLLQQAPGHGVDISEVVSTMDQLEGVGGRWDELSLAIEAFDLMIEEQKKEVERLLEEETVALGMEMDTFW